MGSQMKSLISLWLHASVKKIGKLFKSLHTDLSCFAHMCSSMIVDLC